MAITKPPQQPDGSRCRVELGQAVLLNCLPIARRCWVYRRRFEDNGSDAVKERAVADVGMSSNPTDVSHASELVVGVYVEDIFEGKSSAEEVTTGGMNDTLGFSSRSRSLHNTLDVARCLIIEKAYVEDEERIFTGHDFWRAVVGHLCNLFMPPDVAPPGHGNIVSSALEHYHLLNIWALPESSVDDSFSRDSLAPTFSLIARNQDAGPAVEDTVAKRLGRETSKDDRVNGANTSASEESGESVPSHGEIDGDGVALLDTIRLENICDRADFTEELRV